jgi:hypothetical protein
VAVNREFQRALKSGKLRAIDDLRRRRIAANETIAPAALPSSHLAVDCECGHPNCSDAIVVSAHTYRDVRDRDACIVTLAHVLSIDTILERTDRYTLVKLVPG